MICVTQSQELGLVSHVKNAALTTQMKIKWIHSHLPKSEPTKSVERDQTSQTENENKNW